MEIYHFVWMLAAVTGLTAGGLAGNGWAMVTGERPSLWMLSEYSVSMPLKVLALIAYAPLAMVKSGLSYIDSNPVFAVMVTIAGLLWNRNKTGAGRPVPARHPAEVGRVVLRFVQIGYEADAFGDAFEEGRFVLVGHIFS